MTVKSISKLALACSQLCGELIKRSLDHPPLQHFFFVADLTTYEFDLEATLLSLPSTTDTVFIRIKLRATEAVLESAIDILTREDTVSVVLSQRSGGPVKHLGVEIVLKDEHARNTSDTIAEAFFEKMRMEIKSMSGLQAFWLTMTDYPDLCHQVRNADGAWEYPVDAIMPEPFNAAPMSSLHLQLMRLEQMREVFNVR